MTQKIRYTYVYDSVRQGMHPCLTQEEQVYILVSLRKSRYTYCMTQGRVGIHICRTHVEKVYIILGLMKKRLYTLP